jgi:hypothetical protein
MVPPFIFVSINSARLAQADCRIGFGLFDHEGAVVIHEAGDEAESVVWPDNRSQDGKEYFPEGIFS